MNLKFILKLLLTASKGRLTSNSENIDIMPETIEGAQILKCINKDKIFRDLLRFRKKR